MNMEVDNSSSFSSQMSAEDLKLHPSEPSSPTAVSPSAMAPSTPSNDAPARSAQQHTVRISYGKKPIALSRDGSMKSTDEVGECDGSELEDGESEEAVPSHGHCTEEDGAAHMASDSDLSAEDRVHMMASVQDARRERQAVVYRFLLEAAGSEASPARRRALEQVSHGAFLRAFTHDDLVEEIGDQIRNIFAASGLFQRPVHEATYSLPRKLTDHGFSGPLAIAVLLQEPVPGTPRGELFESDQMRTRQGLEYIEEVFIRGSDEVPGVEVDLYVFNCNPIYVSDRPIPAYSLGASNIKATNDRFFPAVFEARHAMMRAVECELQKAFPVIIAFGREAKIALDCALRNRRSPDDVLDITASIEALLLHQTGVVAPFGPHFSALYSVANNSLILALDHPAGFFKHKVARAYQLLAMLIKMLGGEVELNAEPAPIEDREDVRSSGKGTPHSSAPSTPHAHMPSPPMHLPPLAAIPVPVPIPVHPLTRSPMVGLYGYSHYGNPMLPPQPSLSLADKLSKMHMAM